jgi:hypothetical protein
MNTNVNANVNANVNVNVDMDMEIYMNRSLSVFMSEAVDMHVPDKATFPVDF